MTAPAYGPRPHHAAELVGWAPPSNVVPLHPHAARSRPGLLRGHGRTIAVTAVLAAWVAWMVLALTAHWSVLPPMVTGAAAAIVWGIAGDHYHHRRGQS